MVFKANIKLAPSKVLLTTAVTDPFRVGKGSFLKLEKLLVSSINCG